MPQTPVKNEIFGGKVRVRGCGLLIEDAKVLLIRHEGLGRAGHLWAPPGGGVSFQESVSETIMREFKEETGLDVAVGEFLFVNEYIDDRHHALELFFEVTRTSGEIHLGHDPELTADQQLLTDIRWFSSRELKATDANNLHNVFKHCPDSDRLKNLKGFFKFVNISTK